MRGESLRQFEEGFTQVIAVDPIVSAHEFQGFPLGDRVFLGKIGAPLLFKDVPTHWRVLGDLLGHSVEEVVNVGAKDLREIEQLAGTDSR